MKKNIAVFFISALLILVINHINTYGFTGTSSGNSSGNISNSAIACEKDGWIYFNSGHSLSKTMSDDTILTKLCDDNAFYINISDSTLYYINGSDNFCIYMINSDGSGRSKILNDDAAYLTVYDDWIYFIRTADMKLYKIRKNGTLLTKLCDDYAGFINITDKWIYYTLAYDHGRVCRIKTDGTDRQELPINNASYVSVVNNWIYYINFDDNQCIYKYNMDIPNENIKLTRYETKCMNISGDWIYFVEPKCGSIHKMKADGSTDTELNTDRSAAINIAGNWLYYYNFNSWPVLYRMKSDGSQNYGVYDKGAVAK